MQTRGRRFGTTTRAVNAVFLRDWKAPTVLGLEPAERERVISAAWYFEQAAKVVRRIGNFETDYISTTQLNQQKSDQALGQTACQDERLACIYHYVRGLWRQIFYTLSMQFLDDLQSRAALIGRSGRVSERVYSWDDLRKSENWTEFPKVFFSLEAQDEYIDIMCSFGLEFLHYVLRMSPDLRRKMIVETFFPRYSVERPRNWRLDKKLWHGFFSQKQIVWRNSRSALDSHRDTPMVFVETDPEFIEHRASWAPNRAWDQYISPPPPPQPLPDPPPEPARLRRHLFVEHGELPPRTYRAVSLAIGHRLLLSCV